MLTYSNNVLTISASTIDKADNILKLTSDIDCEFIGVLTLSNNVTKTINFIKDTTFYKARLLLTEEDVPFLNACTFYLVCIEGTTSKNTNIIPIEFDIYKIKNSVKTSSSTEIRDIKVSIAQLTKRLEDIINRAPSILVTPLAFEDTNYIRPGMVPVAIDNTGRCAFQYPFINHITEINGQKTLNNAIILMAKDIPIEQTDVETAIKSHTEAIKELNNYLQTLSSELKTLANKVATIEQTLLTHTDSSII